MSLLDADTLRGLDALQGALRGQVRGQRAGDHRSLRKGPSVEFAEHRPYAPGDDLRRIDWNAYGRLDELVVRLSAAEEDVTLHLLVDASESMATGTPTKWHEAQRIAAAVGYASLTSGERVSLTVSLGGRTAPAAPLRGRGAWSRFERALESIVPEGRSCLDEAARRAITGPSGRDAAAVVLSDALDEGATLRCLALLSAARHSTTFVHLLSQDELDPRLDDDATLVDVETGERLDVAVDPGLLRAYSAKLDAFCREVETECQRRGVRYLAAFAAPPLLTLMARLFAAPARGAR
ncbi:MAG: DUF58 domain-containing protein [Myxococcales bacterium]|nr:DUF58 domain-containing protein [Myxococcales bacterium]